MAKSVSIDKMALEIMEILSYYADTTSDGVKKAVRKTATQVKKDVMSGAPSKSGDYKKSWSTKKVNETSNAILITVYSKNRYQLAHLVEHGHAKRGGGRTKAIPHIAPAERAGIMQLEEEIKRSL